MPSPYEYAYIFKFIIIGDVSTGKSCLLHRFTERTFADHKAHTIGVEFGARIISLQDQRLKLQIWDTAGQGDRSVTRSYYRGAAAAILVYDISRRGTFDHVKSWLEEARELSTSDIVVMLVGNKTDLSFSREVSTEEARNFARMHGLLFTEASAKTNENVDKIFLDLDVAARVYELVVSGTMAVGGMDAGVQKRISEDAKTSHGSCC